MMMPLYIIKRLIDNPCKVKQKLTAISANELINKAL